MSQAPKNQAPRSQALASWWRWLHQACAMVTTFAVVHVAWIFFRARDLETAWTYLQGLVQLQSGGWTELAGVLALAMLTLGLDLPQHLRDDELWPLRVPPVPRGLLVALAVILIALSGTVGRAFIYFQF